MKLFPRFLYRIAPRLRARSTSRAKVLMHMFCIACIFHVQKVCGCGHNTYFVKLKNRLYRITMKNKVKVSMNDFEDKSKPVLDRITI